MVNIVLIETLPSKENQFNVYEGSIVLSAPIVNGFKLSSPPIAHL